MLRRSTAPLMRRATGFLATATSTPLVSSNMMPAPQYFGLGSSSPLCFATSPVSLVARRYNSTSGAPSSEQEPPAPKAEEEPTDAAKEGEKGEKSDRDADEQTLRRLVLGCITAAIGVATVVYSSRKYEKEFYGEQGSARVGLESRGKPKLGGPFTLVTTKGEPVSQADFMGKWVFFYFGFTHCPEICPIELNRMTKVVKSVAEQRPKETLQPLFVSCDPRRDSLEAIDEYLSIFHDDFIGLVGTPNQVNEACKSYRIYYSVPDDQAMSEDDYLIDHSIAIFLFDPNGNFVDFFGNRYKEDEITKKVVGYMDNLKADPHWTNW